jgi:dUTP pyrophosphatase
MSEATLTMKVQKLHPNATLPVRATDGAACFDLHALCESTLYVPPGGSLTVHTGLAFEIPAGHVMLIFSRSGHGFKSDIRLANCVGVIDSDYRGGIQVKLRSDGECPLKVCHGDRIAQAILLPIPRLEPAWSDELTQTARGEGGFGSTGR